MEVIRLHICNANGHVLRREEIILDELREHDLAMRLPAREEYELRFSFGTKIPKER